MNTQEAYEIEKLFEITTKREGTEIVLGVGKDWKIDSWDHYYERSQEPLDLNQTGPYWQGLVVQ